MASSPLALSSGIRRNSAAVSAGAKARARKHRAKTHRLAMAVRSVMVKAS
jgi:hypothetical protein